MIESQSETSTGDKKEQRGEKKMTGLNSNGRCDRKETREFRNRTAQKCKKARNVRTKTDTLLASLGHSFRNWSSMRSVACSDILRR